MSLTKVEDQIISHNGHLLNSITEVMSLVESTEIEHEILFEVGCYLHRVHPVIMEIYSAENITTKMTDIILSLSTNVDRAKELVEAFDDGSIKKLEDAIKCIGCDLNSIPLSAFQNDYTELVINSLSRDMINICHQIKRAQPNEMAESKQENRGTEAIKEAEGEKPGAPIMSKSLRKLNSNISSAPRLADFLKGVYYGSPLENKFLTVSKLTDWEESIEPLYDTFFCPLTGKIMEDPVTIESGVTYERSAINEWLEKHCNETKMPVCPITGMGLHSKTLSTNLAFKTTIMEWKERNEAARLRLAHTALSIEVPDAIVLEAMRELQDLCRRGSKRQQMHNAGITERLAKFLEHSNEKVRSETLVLLQLLAEDIKGKEILVKTRAIEATVRMLSSYKSCERNAAVMFLSELSKSKVPCEIIGAAKGSVFMLITMKNNKSENTVVAEEAGAILRNLEKCPKNIKFMAENGFLQPLLNQLIEGSEEIQMEMATNLSELVLKSDIQTCITEKMSTDLIHIANEGKYSIKRAALKALVLFSSYELNSKILIDSGIIQFTAEKMFTRKIENEPIYAKEDLATILANILQSRINPESIQVTKQGHTMASDYFICNIIYMIRYSMPYDLNMNLIKILACLSNIEKVFSRVVSVVKETKTIEIVIALLNSHHDELIIATTELLIKLSCHIGPTIAEELCKTQGQPEGLLGRIDSNQLQVNKKQAMCLTLLAKLPHHNLALNQALLHKGIVPIILDRINKIQRGEAMTNSWTRIYFEGLVGTLVRFTSTIHSPDILHMARQRNLASVLAGLMQNNPGSEEVQRLAASGLEKLSAESINLAIKHTELQKPTKGKKFNLKSLSMKNMIGRNTIMKHRICPVHRGECSSSNTFCLIEAKAVQGLVSCLESENDGVVEAALGAISTLLDQKVNLEESVRELSEMNAVKKVIEVLRKHQEGSIWAKSLWVIERILVGGGEQSAIDMYKERVLSRALMNAFHQGDDGRARAAAEGIMRKLNQMQNSRHVH